LEFPEAASRVSEKPKINTTVYDELGDRWYTAYDDPVALLRAQSRVIEPWVHAHLLKALPSVHGASVLDIGCGGGLVSNALATRGYTVTGIDLSTESLAVAARHDSTGRVRYLSGDALHLPFPDHSFDAVTCMDFLEHVEDPAAVIGEASRVLKPGGLFFFHTFNRNFLSGIVVIKLVEWFVKNTPPHLHLKRLFIKPAEIRSYLTRANLQLLDLVGIDPVWSTIDLASLCSGTIPTDMEFKVTKNLGISYLGFARKLAQ
jgi:2-polyprenyl-6-hydroxyphenyl methylase/3-demethylubiquinone-9 3-methyltransferase